MAQTRSLWRFNSQNTGKDRFAGYEKEQKVWILLTKLMLQHHFGMSYACYKFHKQMHCIWHALSNIFYNIFLHSNKPILHNVTLKSVIHRRLSDNLAQKKIAQILFYAPIQNNIMYKANITLPYLMCAVEG